MRYGKGTAHFDTSDADQHAVLERTCRALLEQRARAFAQGFTAALEGEASREWLDEYQEKSE
jgi:6-phosphogluconate dehydrogenase